MKNCISVIVVLFTLMSFSATAFAASPETELVCTASSTEANPGSEVTITLALQNAGIGKSIGLVFDYDIQNCFEAPQDSDGVWKLTGAALSSFATNKVACGTAAIAYTSEQNFNREIFTLTLKLKDNAPLGETMITITPTIKNSTVAISCEPATLKLTVKSTADRIVSFAKTSSGATAVVSCTEAEGVLLCASYDEQGKLMGVLRQETTAGEDQTYSFLALEGAVSVKLFLLDGQFRPLCGAASTQ